MRPVFATLPGVSSPPPFGGNQRTIVINVDPQKLQAYGLSPENVVQALTTRQQHSACGQCRHRHDHTLVTTDSTVTQINDLLDIPLKLGSGASVYIRDVGSVADSSDILAGYALLNGKRTVYIPVTKRPDASTLTVVQEVRDNLGALPVARSRRHQDHLRIRSVAVCARCAACRCCAKASSVRCSPG